MSDRMTMFRWMKWISFGILLAAVGRSNAQSSVRSPLDAPVSIIMFSAFSCPYCAQGHKMLEQLQLKYPGKINVIFKHFPLGDDDAALLPHEAAVAAGEQGKFWQMCDALYRDQAAPGSPARMQGLAKTLGLDLKQYNAALSAHAGRERIKADLAEANALKIVATPTFIIEGFKFEGLHTASTFEQIIEHRLSKTNDGAKSAAQP
jgi:protein-disulfide isomerase